MKPVGRSGMVLQFADEVLHTVLLPVGVRPCLCSQLRCLHFRSLQTQTEGRSFSWQFLAIRA